jgi:hypothetical protein
MAEASGSELVLVGDGINQDALLRGESSCSARTTALNAIRVLLAHAFVQDRDLVPVPLAHDLRARQAIHGPVGHERGEGVGWHPGARNSDATSGAKRGGPRAPERAEEVLPLRGELAPD